MGRVIRSHLPALVAAMVLAAGLAVGCQQEVLSETYRPIGPSLTPGNESRGKLANATPAPGTTVQAPKPGFWDWLLGRKKTPQPFPPPPAGTGAKTLGQSVLPDMHAATPSPAK